MVAFLDIVGELLEAADFTAMYSALGQSAIHPGLLALATLLQHLEGISDRQAVERMEDSILWKYALRLDPEKPVWDASVYTEFRTRLLNSNSSELIFDKLLNVAQEMGFLDTSKQRTDATHILSAAKLMNRVELVHECVYDCINELLDEAPSFLMKINKRSWATRYFSERPYNYRVPKTDVARKELADSIAQDATYILEEISKSAEADRLKELMSVKILYRVLIEQFDDSDNGPSFKTNKELGAAGKRLSSPEDLDATCGSKRGGTWLGYKAHFTETFGANVPHLITNVRTTQAHVNDSLVFEQIHQDLKSKGLKPDQHLVDSGYVNVEIFSKCQDKYEILALARITDRHTWQGKAGKGFDHHHFAIDWHAEKVTCPAGKLSSNWKPKGGADGVVNVSFPVEECSNCPFKVDCTTSASRNLQFKAKPIYDWMQSQRQLQQTDEFKKQMGKRSGIESTISYLVSKTGIRRSPYLGQAKVHLNNILAAAAINAIRIGNHLLGKGLAKTRKTRYALLMAAVAA